MKRGTGCQEGHGGSLDDMREEDVVFIFYFSNPTAFSFSLCQSVLPCPALPAGDAEEKVAGTQGFGLLPFLLRNFGMWMR